MRLLVLYGSQTGTAQDIAEQLWRESKQYGFSGPVMAFDDYNIQRLVEETLVVFVVSTTGDGDEPDNMKNSWRFLLKRSLPANSLIALKYACLGLGDSSYSKFNYAAKKLFKRLQNLGGSPICSLGLCDDQHDHGYLGTSLQWSSTLWSTLSDTLGLQQKSAVNIDKWNIKLISKGDESIELNEQVHWTSMAKRHSVKLIENVRTTASDHFQDVRFLRFDCTSSEISWKPGDIIDVMPQNSTEQVLAFFDLLDEHKLEFDASTVVELTSAHDDMPLPLAYAAPISLGHAAKYVWDLSAKPRQRFFEVLGQGCTDEMEREKLEEFCSAEGLDDLIAYVNRPRRNVIEILQDFRYATAELTVAKLFDMMPLIQPRSFSIASDVSSGTLDLLVAVVHYKTILQKPRLGLCSNWLKALPPGTEIPVVLKAGTMRVPADLKTPLIMIGPGTGVAPFRSIIQNRLHARKSGSAIGPLLLFFGCRNRSNDFHFEHDIEIWKELNLVTTFVAFSRDQENKIYVQHLIKDNSSQVAQLIKDDNAHIFVAGSSNDMPKAVREAFIEALGGDASYIEQMIKTRRYQEETWS